VTGEDGRVSLTLPPGSYRFRANYDGVPFWSSPQNGCEISGCESAAVTLPGGLVETEVTIDTPFGRLRAGL